jgi:hypothetical protein
VDFRKWISVGRRRIRPLDADEEHDGGAKPQKSTHVSTG